MKKILLFVALPLLLITFVAYSLWWFKKAEEFESQVENLVNSAKILSDMEDGFKFDYDKVSVSGFPLSFNINLHEMDFRISSEDEDIPNGVVETDVIGDITASISLFSNKVKFSFPNQYRYANTLDMLLKMFRNMDKMSYDVGDVFKDIDSIKVEMNEFSLTIKTAKIGIMYIMFEDNINQLMSKDGFIANVDSLEMVYSPKSMISARHGSLYDEIDYTLELLLDPTISDQKSSILIGASIDGEMKVSSKIMQYYIDEFYGLLLENKEEIVESAKYGFILDILIDQRAKNIVEDILFAFSDYSTSGELSMVFDYGDEGFSLSGQPDDFSIKADDVDIKFGQDRAFGINIDGKMNTKQQYGWSIYPPLSDKLSFHDYEVDMDITLYNGAKFPDLLKEKVRYLEKTYPEYKDFANPTSDIIDLFAEISVKNLKLVDGDNYFVNFKSSGRDVSFNGISEKDKTFFKQLESYKERGSKILEEFAYAYKALYSKNSQPNLEVYD